VTTPARVLISILLIIAAILLAGRSDLSVLQNAASSFYVLNLLQVFGLMFAAGLMAGWRMKLISAEFGVALSYREALSFYAGSTIIGIFLFQFFGQALARSVWLSRRGHSHSVGVLITLYEKGVAAAVSLLMGICGAWYLFHRLSFNYENGGADLVKLGVGITLVLTAACAIGWGSLLAPIIRQQRMKLHFLVSLGKISLLTITAQATTMAAYVLPCLILQPDVQLSDLIATTSLVMLAASIPISFAGWGLREISAIIAMGSIGFLPQNAFLIAVIVGLASQVALVCIVLSALAPSKTATPDPEKASIVTATPKINYDEALGWAVPLCAAMAVFFHLHVPLSAGIININLADPVVIIGAGLFLAKRFGSPEGRPTWSLDHLEICAVSATIVLGLAVFHGILLIGPTEWAITNKFVGWWRSYCKLRWPARTCHVVVELCGRGRCRRSLRHRLFDYRRLGRASDLICAERERLRV
jgi:hypothetical protein